MSQVIAAPELIAAAATDVAGVGSSLDAAHLVAAAPTVAVIPAAADEVSGAIANLFSQHAQSYQELAGQAAAFNSQFVQHLNYIVHAYTATEAANAASLTTAAASTGATDPVALIVDTISGLTNQINTLTNQILNVLHGIAAFPYDLLYILIGAQYGGLSELIVLQEFLIYLQFRVIVPPFAWPFPFGNPVVVPLIP
jgi:hypothetical protein